MKNVIFTLLFLIIGLGYAKAQNVYDEDLAQKLGADDYGMKKYIMAFLLRGDRVSEYSTEQRQKIQAGHMANISRMAEEGFLILAGPFFGNEDLRGIYIFDVASLEAAEELTNTDPAIQAGVLKMDLKEWYGSAALMMLPEIYPKVTKKSF